MTIALNIHTIALKIHTFALNIHTIALNSHMQHWPTPGAIVPLPLDERAGHLAQQAGAEAVRISRRRGDGGRSDAPREKGLIQSGPYIRISSPRIEIQKQL
eukprot:1194513-Prorocentrum_minimum.AAC.1